MADFVPGNIIQTPDFGQMARGYIQQSRQEEAAKNAYLNQFEKANGLYLEGDKPAVQEAWNKVQSTMDMVAENDTPEMRRKLKEAYGEYGQVAGAAQVIADQYRKEVAAYKADPTKFAVSGNDFLNSSEEFRLQRRSVNDIFSTLDNPYALPRSMRYDLLNPYDQAKQLVNDSRMKLSDFYDSEGNLNKGALRAYAEKRARAQVNALPENIEKAEAWGGIKEGYVGGEDGRITSPQELDFLRGQDEDTRAGFVESYINELTNNYVDLVANQLKPSKSGTTKEYLSLEPYKPDAPTVGTAEPDVEFQAFAKPLTGAMKNIVGFGYNKLNELLVEETTEVEERDAQGKKVTKLETRIRKAQPNEIATIKQALKKDYGLSLSENSVSSQEESTNGGMTEEEYQQWLKDNGLDG